MDHQKTFLFLVLLQSGCWIAINSQRESSNSRRFDFKDPTFRCFQLNCARLRATPNLFFSCVRFHCAPALHTARNADYRVSLVPVGLPWSTQRLPTVLCPVSSLTDNQVLRYCTSDSCLAVLPSSDGSAEYDRIERTGGSRCLGMCDDLEDDRYEECVREECCPNSVEEASPVGDVSSQQMSRKRRVNDDVSQCIQSYCSGFSVFRERILCIVKNCNRPVLSS